MAIGNPVAIINEVKLDVMNKAKTMLEEVGTPALPILTSNMICGTDATVILKSTPVWAEAIFM